MEILLRQKAILPDYFPTPLNGNYAIFSFSIKLTCSFFFLLFLFLFLLSLPPPPPLLLFRREKNPLTLAIFELRVQKYKEFLER